MTKEEKDFYLLACRWLETDSVNTVKKYWDAFVEVVVHEVFVKGFCYMPSIGTIHTKTRQGYQEKIKNDEPPKPSRLLETTKPSPAAHVDRPKLTGKTAPQSTA